MNARHLLLFLAAATLLAPLGFGKNKKTQSDPQDSIEVAGHIPIADGAVTRFISTRHYSSHYLYAEHENGKVTLIDVSKPNEPVVLARDVAYPAEGGSGSLSVVAGTAALVSSEPAAPATREPRTIRIMDFSDPRNPKVSREFRGVTGMSRDDGRGLIFVANGEGVWILRQHLALDPEVEKAYANYVLYSH